MKKIFSLFLLCFLFVGSLSTAQDRETLNILSRSFELKIVNDYFIIMSDLASDSFLVKKKPTDRNYSLVNPNDKSDIRKILGVDELEIKSKWENAFQGLDEIDILVNKTATSSNQFLVLNPDEEGGRVVEEINTTREFVEEEEGGQKSIWMNMAIALLIGAIGGAVIVAAFRKKPKIAKAPLMLEEEDDKEEAFEESVKTFSNDAKKITAKAKEDIKNLRADKRQLNADIKKLKASLKQSETQLKEEKKFHETYYKNVLKVILQPANAALEKGDEALATELLIQALAQFTSKARHEIQQKQAYDIANIAQVLKQSIQEENIEWIDEHTPLDRIPSNIKNVLKWMEKNGAHSLGNTALFGYRIKR